MSSPPACPLATKLFNEYQKQDGKWVHLGLFRLNGVHVVCTSKEGNQIQVGEPTAHVNSTVTSEWGVLY